MAEYIEREEFLADKKWLYCTDCDKRKGKKRGKIVTLYEIGEAPCKSCGVHDMLEEVEVYPAADVRPVVYCKDCIHGVQGKKSLECEKHRYVWNNLNRWVNDDDFCSWGIKRGGS